VKNIPQRPGQILFSPHFSYAARNACRPERRLAVGLGIAMTLKADSKSARQTRQ
jgi:hypothetical protein